MNKILILVLMLTLFSFANEKRNLVFSPLPTKSNSKVIRDFLPLISYLEKKLGIQIEFKLHENYEDILKDIEKGNIDIAYLGPLPFVSLQNRYKDIEPIVTFKNKRFEHKYRCVLIKFKDDDINLQHENKIALTQPLSTCGYFFTEKLLKKVFNKELKNQKFDYMMSHENAIISVLKGNFDFAGVREDIAKSYDSLGIEIVSSSELLPGFTLVVNSKTVPNNLKDDIKASILEIPENIYKKWDGQGSYGFENISLDDYKELNVDIDLIPQKGNIDE